MTRKYTLQDQIDAFWGKVDRSQGSNACWLWQSSLSQDGYGKFIASGKHFRAHRFAWQITNGVIPDGLQVLHNCPDGDNPKCVNPAHLWLGTDVDNMKDRHDKGHYATGENHPLVRNPEKAVRGEQSPNTNFTNEIVLEIRQLYATGKYSQPQLAKMFGSSHSTIGRIVNRQVWKHI